MGMLLTLSQLVRRSRGLFNGDLGTSFQLWREMCHHRLRLLKQTSWQKSEHHQMYRCIQNGGDYKGWVGVCTYQFAHALTEGRLSNLQADKHMLSAMLSKAMSYFLSYCKKTTIFIYTTGSLSVYARKAPNYTQKRAPYPPPGGTLYVGGHLQNILLFCEGRKI